MKYFGFRVHEALGCNKLYGFEYHGIAETLVFLEF